MKIETILNAHEEVILYGYDLIDDIDPENKQEYQRRLRQARAFRARIIRMDERNKMMINTLGATVQRQKEEIARLNDSIELVLGDVDDFYGPFGGRK